MEPDAAADDDRCAEKLYGRGLHGVFSIEKILHGDESFPQLSERPGNSQVCDKKAAQFEPVQVIVEPQAIESALETNVE